MALGSAKVFCIIMIILGVLAILAGAASPFWLTRIDEMVHYGIWYACDHDRCASYSWSSDVSLYFIGFHGAAAITSLLAIILLFVSLCTVCGNSDSATGTGVIALIAGIVGIGAGAVFFFLPLSSMGFLNFIGFKSWGSFVFSGGSIVITLFSIILLILPDPKNNTVQPVNSLH